MIQAVAFYKSAWSKRKAQSWLKKHQFKPIKDVHETSQMLHYRLIDPSKFKRYISKPLDDGILLTIGLSGKSSKSRKSKGSGLVSGGGQEGSIDQKTEIPSAKVLVKEGFMPNPLQEVFPLSKESGIIDGMVMGREGYNRAFNKDAVSVDDMTERKILNMTQKIQSQFRPGDMIYDMMLPRSQGGIGFPFPSSAGIFTPTDWYRVWK